MKRQITIEIAGNRYRMVSDADEGHLQELAAVVNERVDALQGRGARAASQTQMLAMAALGLADDLLQSERRGQAVELLAREAITSAIDRIDRRLQADDSLDSGGADE